LRSQPNSDHAIAKSSNTQLCGADSEFNAVLELLHALDVTDVLPPSASRAADVERPEKQADSGPSGES
jgi:hypothetical protein